MASLVHTSADSGLLQLLAQHKGCLRAHTALRAPKEARSKNDALDRKMTRTAPGSRQERAHTRIGDFDDVPIARAPAWRSAAAAACGAFIDSSLVELPGHFHGTKREREKIHVSSSSRRVNFVPC